MKHASLLAVLALALSLGAASACNADGAAFARAGEAEATGALDEAEAGYRAVCARGAVLCANARRRLDRLELKRSWEALDHARFIEARDRLRALAASTDAPTRATAEALLAHPELGRGVEWEEAAALVDHDAALARMEALAAEGVRAGASARAWLRAERPRLLLARAEAACTPTGPASCVEAEARLAALHPDAPERARARDHALAERRRVTPLLRQTETLLAQRVALYDLEQLVELCMAEASLPADFSRAPCETKVRRGRALPRPEALQQTWSETLAAIHDPFFVRPLAERWKRADAEGEHDPMTWPDP